MEFVYWSPPALTVRLPENEIHIWRAKLDVDARSLSELSSLLSADELTRANRFVFPHGRDHFIVGRGALRQILGMYLNRPPQTLVFGTGKYGKVFLVGREDVCFNLTHSHGRALYGFAMNRELGIDVEKIRPEFSGEDIAERYFSLIEQSELRELPADVRPTAFFLCWTRKEAYVKAHGDGLQIALDSFNVSLTPGKSETLQSVDSQRWSLHSFTPEPGYAAAIVAEGKFRSIRFWNFDGSVSKPTTVEPKGSG